MNPLTVKLIASVIRHALGAVGGGAVLASDAEIEQLIGAAAVVVSLLWSAWEKYQTHQQTQRAQDVAVQALRAPVLKYGKKDR